MTRLLIATVGVLLVLSASAQEGRLADAVEVLRNENPDVIWDPQSSVSADVSCDGIADTAVVGYQKHAVWLGVVFGSKSPRTSKPTVLRFELGKEAQNSFCAMPVSIEVRPIDCTTEDGPLPGCRPIKGCMAFSMVDERCDSHHFYWDSIQKSLAWWRR